MELVFHKTFSLNRAVLADVRYIVRQQCLNWQVADDDIDNLGTAITEFLVNLIEHAQGEDSRINFSIKVLANQFQVELIDNTEHFQQFYATAHQGINNINSGDLLVSGMGLGLILSLFPACQYYSTEQVQSRFNHLRLVVPCKAEQQATEQVLKFDGYADQQIKSDIIQLENLSVESFGSVIERKGGDFLLHHKSSNGDWLVVGDVMGHDTKAMHQSLVAQGFILGCLQSDISSPKQLANKLAKVLFVDALLPKSFLTCIILRIHADSIEFANLGHPAPFTLNQASPSQSAHFELVGTVQPVLGLVETTDYTDEVLQLNSGQQLFLYTDGWLENNDKNALGIQALASILKAVEGDEQSAHSLWLRSLPKLSRQEDDASLICVRLDKT